MIIHSTLNTIERFILPGDAFSKDQVVKPTMGITIDVLRHLGHHCGSQYANFQNVYSSTLIYPLITSVHRNKFNNIHANLIGTWLMRRDAEPTHPASFVVALEIYGPNVNHIVTPVLEIIFQDNQIMIPDSVLDDRLGEPLPVFHPFRPNFYALVQDFVRHCGSRAICSTYKVSLRDEGKPGINLARVWNTGDIYGVGGVHPLPAWIETELGIGD